MKTGNKTGRKQKHFEDPKTGTPVIGLSRRPSDGRWRIIGTQITFSESDEQKAIERFREITNPPLSAEQQWAKGVVASHEAARQDFDPFANQRHPFWEKLAKEIYLRPNWIAEATGIEWISYGLTLQPPTPLPPLSELEANWTTYGTSSVGTKRRTLADWKEFVASTGIEGLAEITDAVAIGYRDSVFARNLSPKRQQHLFNHVRRILTFNANNRAVAREAIAKALASLKLLIAHGDAVSLDPMPISKSEWVALLGKAVGDNKAMILLMLNAALYLQEVVNLTWENITNDGCLIAHRKKRGKFIRVAVLWQETLDALKMVKRTQQSSIFISETGLPLTVSGAGKRFRKLRKAAEITVEANQLRDGAATAAAEANVNSELLNLLLGHRSGMKDHYVKRSAMMVKPATDAVYAKYFPKPNQEQLKQAP